MEQMNGKLADSRAPGPGMLRPGMLRPGTLRLGTLRPGTRGPYEARRSGCRREFVVHMVPLADEREPEACSLLTRLAAFRDPGVARLFEFGREGDTLYVVFEAVSGPTLPEYCRVRALRRDRGIALVARIADIVQNLHEHDLAHGDLRPSNIVIDEHGDPVLMSVGIAALPGKRPRMSGGSRPGPEADPAGRGDLRDRDISGLGMVANTILFLDDKARDPAATDPNPLSGASVAEPLAWGAPVLHDVPRTPLRAIVARALAATAGTAGNRFVSAAAIALALRNCFNDPGLDDPGLDDRPNDRLNDRLNDPGLPGLGSIGA